MTDDQEIALILVLLVSLPGLAQTSEVDSAWEALQKAVELHNSSGESDQIVALCQVAVKETTNPGLQSDISTRKVF
jgi:hypothetical protein